MIEEIIRQLFSDLTQKQEAYIISLFGSRERAEEMAPYCVIEYDPPSLTETNGEWAIRIVTRIRLKTQEERDGQHLHSKK